jgi:hypothetical protein
LGHVGFSFDEKPLSDPSKKIFGFGPDSSNEIVRDILERKAFIELLSAGIPGKVTDDTAVFRDFIGINPSFTAYCINCVVSEKAFQWGDKKLEEFPKATYGYQMFHQTPVENCITYPINLLAPKEAMFNLISGEIVSYRNIPSFGGELAKFLEHFNRQHPREGCHPREKLLRCVRYGE